MASGYSTRIVRGMGLRVLSPMGTSTTETSPSPGARRIYGFLTPFRRAYCRSGVREYLVWLVAEARLEWFCLEDDDYRPQLPDAQGVLHSRVFPGLRLPVSPLLAGDTAKVMAAPAGHEPLNRKPHETSVIWKN